MLLYLISFADTCIKTQYRMCVFQLVLQEFTCFITYCPYCQNIPMPD